MFSQADRFVPAAAKRQRAHSVERDTKMLFLFFLIFKFKKNLNWSIVDLQCCVSFWYSKVIWLYLSIYLSIYQSIYLYSFLDSFPL